MSTSKSLSRTFLASVTANIHFSHLQLSLSHIQGYLQTQYAYLPGTEILIGKVAFQFSYQGSEKGIELNFLNQQLFFKYLQMIASVDLNCLDAESCHSDFTYRVLPGDIYYCNILLCYSQTHTNEDHDMDFLEKQPNNSTIYLNLW